MNSAHLISHTPLEKPVRVTEQSWATNVRPVVSVICTAYQHVNFIRQAIEGFLMQETTFPIEILIHDDASTDGTAEIVNEYADRYPDLIKATLQKENQYSRGNRPGIILSTMSRGKYLAICEGDDYWISPSKIQDQCKFLEENSKINICGGICKIEFDAGVMNSHASEFKPKIHKSIFTVNEIISEFFLHTSTLLVRKNSFININFPSSIIAGDQFMRVMCSHPHGAGFIWKEMSVYRVHEGGTWSSMLEKNKIFDQIKGSLIMDSVLNYEYHENFKNRIYEMLCSLIKDKFRHREIFSKVWTYFYCMHFIGLKYKEIYYKIFKVAIFDSYKDFLK